MPAADDDAPALNPPDVDRAYANYRAQCRRLGVKPAPRDRARKLIQEWTETLAAAARADAPPTH